MSSTLFRLSRHSHWYITFHLAQGLSSLSSHPHAMHMCGCLWVARLLFLPLPTFHLFLPVHPLHVLRRLWLRDKQPARLRQRDLRHPGRFLPAHRWWAQRHGARQRLGAQRLGPQQVHWLPGFPRPLCSFVRPRRGWRDTRQATRRSTPRKRRSWTISFRTHGESSYLFLSRPPWSEYVTFFAWFSCKATLEETELIHLCRTVNKSRTMEVNTFITLGPVMTEVLW